LQLVERRAIALQEKTHPGAETPGWADFNYCEASPLELIGHRQTNLMRIVVIEV
jgi:hypothetical protein